MPHHHHHASAPAGRVLLWSLAATTVFVVIELVAGIQAHSLALLSDAGHNFTDAVALALAALGWWLGTRPPNNTKTYGYHRAGVLAAFVNALTLVVLSGFIFWESRERLLEPPQVSENIMIVVAGLGLVVNVAIMWGLHASHRHDINIRAAWVHMLGDALGSVAIIIGALVIGSTGWQIIDPILSILIGLLIIWTAWDIIKESLNILLEGMPKGMSLERVASEMRSVTGVIEVHDLHIWSLGSSAHALSCHVLIEDLPPSESEAILKQINERLCEGFAIHHTTIQFEHQRCAPGDAACSMGLEVRRG